MRECRESGRGGLLLLSVCVPAAAVACAAAVTAGVRLHALMRKAAYYERAAYTDLMTGLGNRAACDRVLNGIDCAAAAPRRLAFVVVDLNNLKQINDSRGHQAGDALIRSIAGCMREAFAGVGEVYRNGGDEFVVIAQDTEPERLCACVNRLHRLTDEHNCVSDVPLEYALGCTAGCVGREACSVRELLRAADEEMYRDKSRCKQPGSRP